MALPIVARLEPFNDITVAWEQREGWRVVRIATAQATLEGHWARVVLTATRQGDPLAFGIDRLRDGRTFFAKALQTLEASLPPDRSEELRRAESDLAHLSVNHRHAVGREAQAERRLREAASRRFGSPRNKTELVLARAEVTFAGGAVERTSAAVSTATTVVAAERQAVSERAAAEARSVGKRVELRQALRTVDKALATTRLDRVRAALDAPTGSRLGQLLGAPPEDAAGRAAWCGLAYRLETALDDTATMSRLGWSKDPVDRLTRGLLDVDPVALVRAQEIITAVVATASQPRTDLADPIAWEQATHVGMKAVRQASRNHEPDVAAGFGL